jgi:hypothetical protein
MSHWIPDGLGAVVRGKFGPGALGRLGTVVNVGVVMTGAVAVVMAITHPEYAFYIVCGIFGLLAIFLIAGFSYALIHPEAATMDSSDFTRVRLKELGAKDVPPRLIAERSHPIENPMVIEASAAERKLTS